MEAKDKCFTPALNQIPLKTWCLPSYRSPSYIIDNLFLASDYRKKIDLSKKKADEAKSEAVADAEMDFLQKELEEELKREHLLREELR